MTTYTVICLDDDDNEFAMQLETGTTVIDSDGDVMILQDDGRFRDLDDDRSWGANGILVRYILSEAPKPVKRPPIQAPADWTWALIHNPDAPGFTDWIAMLKVKSDSNGWRYVSNHDDRFGRRAQGGMRILRLYPDIPTSLEQFEADQ